MEITTETTSDKSVSVNIPAGILDTFQRTNAFLAHRYQNTVPSPEELIVFFLSGVGAHEVVTSLERQVLLLSGKQPPEYDEHLVQTYLDIQTGDGA